jgi:FlaA1/EpsC-like NDP-sugar epimerase
MKENHSTLKYDFSNRVVLVTGGTGSLGRAIGAKHYIIGL